MIDRGYGGIMIGGDGIGDDDICSNGGSIIT